MPLKGLSGKLSAVTCLRAGKGASLFMWLHLAGQSQSALRDSGHDGLRSCTAEPCTLYGCRAGRPPRR